VAFEELMFSTIVFSKKTTVKGSGPIAESEKFNILPEITLVEKWLSIYVAQRSLLKKG